MNSASFHNFPTYRDTDGTIVKIGFVRKKTRVNNRWSIYLNAANFTADISISNLENAKLLIKEGDYVVLRQQFNGTKPAGYKITECIASAVAGEVISDRYTPEHEWGEDKNTGDVVILSGNAGTAAAVRRMKIFGGLPEQDVTGPSIVDALNIPELSGRVSGQCAVYHVETDAVSWSNLITQLKEHCSYEQVYILGSGDITVL